MITDPSAEAARPLSETVRQAIQGGASVIQLRDKSAPNARQVELVKELLKVTRPAGVPLIVNDRVAVALIAGADGVHLGQDDGPLSAAREVLGPDALIGRSTHSPEQAKAAEAEGADYIGVGPVFGTPTKPAYTPVGLDLVRFAAGNIQIPFVAIGGIDASNVAAVRAAGARAVAVVRAVMAASDPRSAAAQLLGAA